MGGQGVGRDRSDVVDSRQEAAVAIVERGTLEARFRWWKRRAKDVVRVKVTIVADSRSAASRRSLPPGTNRRTTLEAADPKPVNK